MRDHQFAAVLLSVILAVPLFQANAAREPSDQLKIAQMRGEVFVCLRNACEPASLGQVVEVGRLVKTGARGWALLKTSDKDTFELRENSRMMVDQLKSNNTRLSVLLGRVKARVHAAFFQRKRVSFATPAGVMAVRGTELLIDVNNSGHTGLDVLYGRVDMVNPDSGKVDSVFIQGEAGRMKPSPDYLQQLAQAPQQQEKKEGLGPQQPGGPGGEQEEGGPGEGQGPGDEGEGQGKPKDQLAEGQPGGPGGDEGEGPKEGAGPGGPGPGPFLGGEDEGGFQQFQGLGEVAERGELNPEAFAEAFGGQQGMQNFMVHRQESQEAAFHFVKNESAAAAEVVQVARENDLASGRTSRDYHGNLVRVEQRIFRPADNKIQFVNMVKRDTYQYKGFFDYKTPDGSAGATGKRFDSFEADIVFDRGLPANLGDWPSFFSDNGDSMKVLEVNAKISNGTDFLKWNALYNKAKDEVGGTVCGGATSNFGVDCFMKTSLGFTDGLPNGSVLGEWQVKDCDSSTCAGLTEEKNEGPNGDLWNSLETPINVITEVADTGNFLAPGNSADLWLLEESYVIGTGGNILNIDAILESDIVDPFTFMRTVAAQSVITVKASTYNKTTNAGTTFFRKGNIDLVIIPDLGVDLVQKFAAHLGDSL